MFKYGPIVYITDFEEEAEGNYYWPGLPPVAYDDIGIPIDENGHQCLPGECILHLNYAPTETEWNAYLENEIPTIASVREWFDDNFLIVTDYNLCKYILRWYWWNNQYTDKWKAKKANHSISELLEKIWPDVPKS